MQRAELTTRAGRRVDVQRGLLAALQCERPRRADDDAEAAGRAALLQRQPMKQRAGLCLLRLEEGCHIEAVAVLDLRLGNLLQALCRRVEQRLEEAAPLDLF